MPKSEGVASRGGHDARLSPLSPPSDSTPPLFCAPSRRHRRPSSPGHAHHGVCPPPRHIIKNNFGYTALIWGSLNGHTEIVRALLEADPSPEHIRIQVRGVEGVGVGGGAARAKAWHGSGCVAG